MSRSRSHNVDLGQLRVTVSNDIILDPSEIDANMLTVIFQSELQKLFFGFRAFTPPQTHKASSSFHQEGKTVGACHRQWRRPWGSLSPTLPGHSAS